MFVLSLGGVGGVAKLSDLHSRPAYIKCGPSMKKEYQSLYTGYQHQLWGPAISELYDRH